ncbi:MAG: alpha/beta hydrolase family protein [Acidimicrobiia bacterium]
MKSSGIRYGPARGQVADLWMPAVPPQQEGALAERPSLTDVLSSGLGIGHDGPPRPVVVLLHGGSWRVPYTKILMRKLARDVMARGWAAWNVEYGRVGFGGRGGWPNTFLDVAAAIDRLHRVPGVDSSRVVAVGHSAGGALALWAAARHRLAEGRPGASPLVGLRGVVGLAPAVDLVQAAGDGSPDNVVVRFLGGPPERHPDRYADASPIERVPIEVPQILIHGSDDRTIAPASSEIYVARAAAAGDRAKYELVDGVDHRSIIRPDGPAWELAVSHIARLLGEV